MPTLLANKAFLRDPFEPEKPDETQFWQGVLNVTHEQFIASVKQGRGDRLKDKDHPELFSGLVWTGQQALPLGLMMGWAMPDRLRVCDR